MMVCYDEFMKKILTLLMGLTLSGCSIFSAPEFTSKSILLSQNAITQQATLSRCVDGDTAHFIINGKIQKVRFLSIDAPEVDHENEILSEPYALIAADYTCQTLMSAITILIESDPYEDPTDQYDRVLAWIWVDEVLLNAKLVELGYAQVAFVKTTNLHSADLKKLEAHAKKADLGLWKN